MKKKSFVVIVILLIAIILGLCVFIAYDKNLFGIKGETKKKSNNIVEKKDDTNTTKEVEINSELVQNLVYPTVKSNISGVKQGFVLADVSINDYSRDDKMMIAQSYPKVLDGDMDGVCPDNSNAACIYYSASDIKDNYLKMFGPDDNYTDGDVKGCGCGCIGKYYKDENKYEEKQFGCGGAFETTSYENKIYKAEVVEDYLYVYSNSIITYYNAQLGKLYIFTSDNSYNSYITSGDDSKVEYIINNESETQSKLEELINSGKANTYIWTFKKQSDGKYYYYSSKWQ